MPLLLFDPIRLFVWWSIEKLVLQTLNEIFTKKYLEIIAEIELSKKFLNYHHPKINQKKNRPTH